MIRRGRVGTSPDMERMSAALRSPGIDPRIWVSYAIVTDIFFDAKDGVFADITLMPSQDEDTARVGALYAGNGWGLYFPIEVDDEVVVMAPSGDPNEGLVILPRRWSAADKPPGAIGRNPTDAVLVMKPGASLRIVTSDGGKVVLGEETDGPLDGIVHGQGIDPFTGQSYTALGNTSDIVRAAK